MDLISLVCLAAFIALVGWVLFHELQRARACPLEEAQAPGAAPAPLRRRLRRRLLGLLCLCAAVATVVLEPVYARWADARPAWRLFWLGMAFVWVMIAVVLAAREVREIGEQAERDSMALLRESLLEARTRSRSEVPAPQGARAGEKPSRGRARRKRRK